MSNNLEIPANSPPIPLTPPPSIPKNYKTIKNNENLSTPESVDDVIDTTPQSKRKIPLTVNTNLSKQPSNSSLPKAQLPHIIQTSSPPKLNSNSPLPSTSLSGKKLSQSTNNPITPMRKKKVKLSSSRNSFLHGSPLYGEVSNKMSLLFHAAHNEKKKKKQKQKQEQLETDKLTIKLNISPSSSPRNSTSSYSSSPIVTSSSNPHGKYRLSTYSTYSNYSDAKSTHSTLENISTGNSYEKSLASSRKKSYESNSASFISALSNNSVSPTNSKHSISSQKNLTTQLNTENTTITAEDNTVDILEENINDNDDDDNWSEGMFDHFSFENMVSNRFAPMENNLPTKERYRVSSESAAIPQKQNRQSTVRVVSEPSTTKNSTVGLEFNTEENPIPFNFHKSEPTTRKASEAVPFGTISPSSGRKIPPMSNNVIKAKPPVPLQLQPINASNQKSTLDNKSDLSPSKVNLARVSTSNRNSTTVSMTTNVQAPKSNTQDITITSISPIRTESSSSSKTSRNVSRSGSIHSRSSNTSTLPKNHTGHYNISHSHKRSSSKSSFNDISTPKSFFKFFGSKKYATNIETVQQRNSNGHSYSNSQGSDTYSLHSNSGISPVLSTNPTLQTNKYNTTISSEALGKNSLRSKWEENKRLSTMSSDIDKSGNNTPSTTSPTDSKKPTPNIYSNLNTGSMPTLAPSKNSASNSCKSTIYDLKIRNGSVESLGSTKSNNRTLLNNPTPSSTDSSNLPSATSLVFHHKPTKSSDSTVGANSRNSVLSFSQLSLSAGNTPTSANPGLTGTSETSPTSAQTTRKVKSLVKLGSKSIKYSRGSSALGSKSFSKGKRFSGNSDWDTWDGRSGSFEKIGPVGKKPNPPGQTIPVITTSNLHSVSGNKNSPASLQKPTIARLSSSSLPTLLSSTDNQFSPSTEIPNLPPPKFITTGTQSSVGSNNTSNSNLLSIYAAPSNDQSTVSLQRERSLGRYEEFNLSPKFLPKGSGNSTKVMVTSNFVDYKLLDYNQIPTVSKLTSILQYMFRFKSEIQFYLTEVGLTKDQLGKKLDKNVVQNIWDSLETASLKSPLVFYVTSDDKLKIPDTNTSPNKSGISHKSEHHLPHHDKTEETSLYTTSSYTNSINSDSSFDKNQRTPQHMISVRRDSSVDYWNFKDSIERRPSLNRAISVTHSSITGDGNTMAPNLSRKTSKVSVHSGGNGLASQPQGKPPTSRSSSKVLINQTSQPLNPNDKMNQSSNLKSSFKVIHPQKPHVDFDNKRASPFVKSKNLVAQRFPPPPPLSTSTTSATTTAGNNSTFGPTGSSQHSGKSDTDLSSTSKQMSTIEKPPIPGFSRGSRNQKKKKMVSNSLRSLQRSNTQGSVFSSMSSSSGVSVDPFSENKVSFNHFDSDDSISTGSKSSDDDSSDDEFGLFAKMPESKKSGSKKVKKLQKLKLSQDSITKTPSSLSDNETDDDDDHAFDLFQKLPKNLNGKNSDKKSISNESDVNSSDKQKTPVISNDTIDDDQRVQLINTTTASEDIKNASVDESTSVSDSIVSSPTDSSSSLSSSLDLRPPPEVLYNNLEVFFPKADLDKLIIDENSTGGTGFGRMKSIRIIAQEASRRTSYREPIAKNNKIGQMETNAQNRKNPVLLSTNLARKNSSLLRRKSTKMWGQKVVEVNLKNKGQKVIPTRGKNGEIVEFAWIKGELIGIGKFGKVYVAMNVTTGDLIAVKQMVINHKFLNRKETNDIVDTFKAEVDSLKDLDHINIVQYLGFEIKDNTYSIFLEYVSGGSIGHLLRKYGKFEESLVKDLTVQMLQGLNYIHSKGILHRDLKADNLLLEIDGVLKISDFGISKRAKDIYTSQSKLNFQGTIFWMAPEIINDTNGSGYNAKVDIWAAGCVVLEMFTGERPWSKYEGEGVLYKLGKEKLLPPIKKEIRKDISNSGKHFMRRCFEIDATRRPTAQTLLADPFCEVSEDYDFFNTLLGKKIHVVEETERENLNRRMKSMVRKL